MDADKTYKIILPTMKKTSIQAGETSRDKINTSPEKHRATDKTPEVRKIRILNS